MAIEFPGPYTGTGPDVTLIDPGGAPTTIIDTDDPFQVQVDWSVGLPQATLLGGQWLVRAYAESVGPGQEIQLGAVQPTQVPVSNFIDVPPDRRYQATINVPAGSLEAESDAGAQSSGVYKLVVVLTHQNLGSATVIAGFSEGPLIQLREP